jgi:hypothetical protein
VTSSRIAITLTACGLLAFTVNVHAQATTGPNTTTLDPPKIVAITGGKLLTITHGTIENGVVILENGKITAVGPASTKVPKDAQVFEPMRTATIWRKPAMKSSRRCTSSMPSMQRQSAFR